MPLTDKEKKECKSVAFDVDGTLIRETDYGSVPRYEIIDLVLWFNKFNYDLYIWSGSGVDYAKTWSEKLGITCCRAVAKGSFVPDIAVDDQDVLLGLVNIKV